MRGARSLAALALVALVAAAGVAAAAGPLDGAYALTGTGPDMDPVTLALMVTQNGSQVGIAVLDPLDSSWTFLVGGLTDDQRVAGPLLFGDGLEAGSLDVRFQGTSVTGTVTLFDVQFSVNGDKIL